MNLLDNLPNENKGHDPQLRAAAEAQLANTLVVKSPERPIEELLHELQVHQIELEMQNDALRQTQIALEESRDRYVDLYEFAPIGYLTLTLHGLIAQINLTGATLLRKDRNKLLQKRFTSFVIPEDQDRWTRHFMSVKKDSTQGSIEITLQRGDETFFYVQLDCLYQEIGGDNAKISITLSDITERKRIEIERACLYQTLQDRTIDLEKAIIVAERANLSKSDFLSSVSHELRTPLNAILGFAQLMESGSSEPTPIQRRNIDQILKAGWYLLELINEILDLTLIESRKLSLSLEPVSLTEVMHECETMIEPQAQKYGISVTFTRNESAYFVNADRRRVKQVLINLLSNAIKYNTVGGSVVVDCIASTRGSIRICVKDTGEGLSSDKLAQLFQPFNRLGKESDSDEGIGIGLVVCKKLIELMKGNIGVESIVGKGSVFWIELNLTTLPCPDACTHELTALTQTPTQGDKQVHHLLYVEDDPANLMLVEELAMHRPDIRLLIARNGEHGIELAQASLPDVILMDINLPGISGLTALKILAETPATEHIPVIALSANAIPQDIEHALEAGFFRYLTKPVKIDEFMNTLDVALKFSKTEWARVHKKEKYNG